MSRRLSVIFLPNDAGSVQQESRASQFVRSRLAGKPLRKPRRPFLAIQATVFVGRLCIHVEVQAAAILELIGNIPDHVIRQCNLVPGAMIEILPENSEELFFQPASASINNSLVTVGHVIQWWACSENQQITMVKGKREIAAEIRASSVWTIIHYQLAVLVTQ